MNSSIGSEAASDAIIIGGAEDDDCEEDEDEDEDEVEEEDDVDVVSVVNDALWIAFLVSSC